MNKNVSPKRKGKHLTYPKRCVIEALLGEGQSIRYIAEKIDYSPSTVSREIRNHTVIQKSHSNDCLNRSNCNKKHACGSISCTKKCKTCNKCKKHCSEYIQAFCDTLEERGLCNGCNKINCCHFEKHLYKADVAENEVSVVEMDCVEGKKEDSCAILTLHFVTFHMQLYYIMPEHTTACVVSVLDMIEEAIGCELFAELFEVLLTDNGHEFWDIDGMERSITEGLRTKVFFCEPNRSDQKGACENNHKLFRCIVPKGTSIDGFNQADMVMATNHVNSYCRKSLFGSCPYELAMRVIPEDFFILLGLELVDAKDVQLTPSLLKRYHTAN